MHAVCKVPFCHPQYNKKAVFLEFYCLLSIYFWGRVFDNLGGAGEQIKILGHLFTPGNGLEFTSFCVSNKKFKKLETICFARATKN